MTKKNTFYPQRVDKLHQFWDADEAESCAREIAREEERDVIIETHVGDFLVKSGGTTDPELIPGTEPPPHPVLGRVRPTPSYGPGVL
jgi:hypothetical protein